MCVEDLVVHAIILEFENRDVSIGGGAGEETAGFMR
jgi:hypothetical protein